MPKKKKSICSRENCIFQVFNKYSPKHLLSCSNYQIKKFGGKNNRLLNEINSNSEYQGEKNLKDFYSLVRV